MNERELRLLIDNGLVLGVLVKSTGAKFHAEFKTQEKVSTALTVDGRVKTWSSIDGAVRWIKKIGLGRAEIDFSMWQPKQKTF